MRFPVFMATLALAALCAVAPAYMSPAHAEKRVAFVVGNGAYLHADRLANPVNDARGVRDALKGIGFDVTYGENLDQKALRRAIGDFARAVNEAAVAIVYFAGHGATFGDTSYVVPVDAEFSSLEQAPYDLVAVETLIGELRRVNGVRIAILDACRDNAAERELKRQADATRGGGASRGLAPVKNPDGLILAYATQYLSTAADGAGANSPFTAALLHNIATPGLDVKDLFFKVGQEVVTATGRKQRPEISISMYDSYALVPAKLSAAPSAPPPARPYNLPPLSSLLQGTPAKPADGAQAAIAAPLVRPAMPAADPCRGTVAVSVASGCAPLTAPRELALMPRDSFRECENCPEMVAIQTGAFTMGSPGSEKGRDENESPMHVVTIKKPFAAGMLHVTVGQYRTFVAETGYEKTRPCHWSSPGFAQEDSHPVVCVTWDDAKAYANWLAKKTGKPYRLLSESEWEYAARGRTSPGTYPRFWFGNDEAELCRYGNFADRSYGNAGSCDDGYVKTSPAGHYPPNAFGLYDMAGNVWQWTEDCYHDSYLGALEDGSAFTVIWCRSGNHAARGGSWFDSPKGLRSAIRAGYSDAITFVGFRVARTLAP